ncbi:KilA-N domain-containing protein [Nostoc sp.]|uniref:KilA-N domain-containing protein n=1 Tax=Nostoc sp. TaxID=1180 RepID=UPI002FF476A3
MSLSKISYQLFEVIVQQRICDGYINSTQLCKAHKETTGEEKYPKYWLLLDSTKAILVKLSEVTNIPIENLTEVISGRNGGTWLHPRLAVRFAMWLSDDFSLQVEDWVQKWFTTEQNPVQISFSELNNLVGLLDTAIQAAEMTHTILHGLTYFLNRARENLEIIRDVQDTENIINNSIYQQQVEKAENRLNNLADRVDNLKMMNVSQESKVIQTIDLDIKDYQKSKEAVLQICNQSYNSKLIEFLLIQPDTESDGSAPVLLEFKQGTLTVNYKKLDSQIKSILNITNNANESVIVIDYNRLKTEILKSRDGSITLDAYSDQLYLYIDYGSRLETVTIPNLREIVDSDIWSINDFWFPYVIEIDEKLIKQLKIKVLYDNPDTSKQSYYWEAFIIGSNIWISHCSTIAAGQCKTTLSYRDPERETFRFQLHESVVELIATFDQIKLKMQIEYDMTRALINLNNNTYLLTQKINKEHTYSYDHPYYSPPESLFERNHGINVSKSDFYKAIESFASAGSEYVNLNFQNDGLHIKDADKETSRVITIKTNISVYIVSVLSINLLLNILKAFEGNNVCFAFYKTSECYSYAQNFLHIGYRTYIDSSNPIYVWYSILEAIELSDKIRNSNGSSCESVITAEFKPVYWKVEQGKNSDGSEYILEAVQKSPHQRFCQLQIRTICP